MLERAHAGGVLTGWVTADEAYGQNRRFRDWLAARAVPFVLATRSDDVLACPDGRRYEAKMLAALAGADSWERRSAGPGAHGERLYDWTVLTLDAAGLPAGWGHWLLVRRQIPSKITPPPGKEPELAFYRCAGPAATPVPELIRVAGARWAIEECFQTAKNEPALISTRSAPGEPGTRTSRSRCSPPPTSPPPAPRRRKRGIHYWRRRPDRADQQRDPPPARHARPRPAHLPNQHAQLVRLATPPATSSPRLPLPTPRPPTTMTMNCRCSSRRRVHTYRVLMRQVRPWPGAPGAGGSRAPSLTALGATEDAGTTPR